MLWRNDTDSCESETGVLCCMDFDGTGGIDGGPHRRVDTVRSCHPRYRARREAVDVELQILRDERPPLAAQSQTVVAIPPRPRENRGKTNQPKASSMEGDVVVVAVLEWRLASARSSKSPA